LFVISNISEVASLADGGSNYCLHRIEESIEPARNGIFTVKKSAVMDTLKLPDFKTLNNLCTELRSYYELPPVMLSKYCKLENGVVCIDDNLIQTLKESYTYRADTPEAKQLLTSSKELQIAMNNFHNTLIDVAGIGFFDDLPMRKYFRFKDRQVTINDDFYSDIAIKLRQRLKK